MIDGRNKGRKKTKDGSKRRRESMIGSINVRM